MEEIKYVELMAKKDDTYSLYVFKDLNTNAFIMCTVLPNWQIVDITVGAKGFLKYQAVKAGEKYYEPNTSTYVNYRYTNQYFINFIKEGDKQTNQEQIIL